MRILVVEDEALLAAELEFMIEDAGLTPSGFALDSAEARALLEQSAPDVALVDIHLLDGPTGVEVAREAAELHGVVAVFMTANRKRIPEDFAGACGAIAKPYTSWGMTAALRFIADCMEEGRASGPAPASLELAPDWARRWSVAAE
ncbi:response regulator [Methylopila sp. Yamaguchi]|uniref:response regulator n=1 Tax=Methylopila sp. Yamaguchi TaxID=1437817 RepID=UPI000CB0E9CA|nr:response regulator [Methylopila sp. Yamaguchi]GBD47707.1 response regulator receiver protein [Methylopila sp. Yamaguchi]